MAITSNLAPWLLMILSPRRERIIGNWKGNVMRQVKVKALTFGASLLAAVGVVASSANACIPEPPPAWSSLLRTDGPALFIGRVTTVERLAEPSRTPTIEVIQSKATIARLETLQGAPQETYTLTAAETARPLGGYQGMICVDFQRVKPGDVVLAMETQTGAVRVFEPQQVPPQFSTRLEAYR